MPKATDAQFGRLAKQMVVLSQLVSTGERDQSIVRPWIQRAIEGKFASEEHLFPESFWDNMRSFAGSLSKIEWMSHAEADTRWKLYDERGEADSAYLEQAEKLYPKARPAELWETLLHTCAGLGYEHLWYNAGRMAEVLVLDSFMRKLTGQAFHGLFGREVKDPILRRHYKDIADFDLRSEVRVQVASCILGNVLDRDIADIIQSRWSVWQKGYAVFGNLGDMIFAYRKDTPWEQLMASDVSIGGGP